MNLKYTEGYASWFKLGEWVMENGYVCMYVNAVSSNDMIFDAQFLKWNINYI
jgi:hypothetical protein